MKLTLNTLGLELLKHTLDILWFVMKSKKNISVFGGTLEYNLGCTKCFYPI